METICQNTPPRANPNDALQADPAAAAAWLANWAGDLPVALWRLDPATGRKDGETFTLPKDIEAAERWIAEKGNSSNLYYHLNAPHSDRPRIGKAGKLAKDDVSLIRGIVLDLDPRADFDIGEERGAIREALERFSQDVLPPTAVVDSGGGFQALFLFPEPLPGSLENRAQVEGQAKALGKYLSPWADATQSIGQPFRIPYTVNRPNATKIANGRKPSLAREVTALTDWGRRHTLTAIRHVAPVTSATAPEKTGSETLPDFDYDAVLDAVLDPEQLSPQEREIVASCKRDRDAIVGDASGNRSRCDYRTAAHCIRKHRITDPTQLGKIVFSICSDRLLGPKDEGKSNGEYYARVTLHNALKANWPDSNPEDHFTPIEPGTDEVPEERKKRADFFSAASLQGEPVPEREWVVKGLIPSGVVTLLSGDGGTGKSLLALQLAAAMAIGAPWLGQEVKFGTSVFLSAEDDRGEIHRRVVDIARAEAKSLADLGRLKLSSLAGEDALLATQQGPTMKITALFREIDAYLAEADPTLLVLDTSADLFGGDEINRTQVRQFIGYLRGLAMKYGCAVVLLSHPSLTGMNSGSGLSGSTAWHNSVRSRLYLERIRQRDGSESDPDLRQLSTKKANYGPTGAEITMRWRGGVFVPQYLNAEERRAEDTCNAERFFLEMLKRFREQGRKVNPTAGPNYAPRVFSEHPDNEGFTRNKLRDAMSGLLDGGKIKIVESGPPSRPIRYLELVEPAFISPSSPVHLGVSTPLHPPFNSASSPLRAHPPIPPGGLKPASGGLNRSDTEVSSHGAFG